MTARTQFLLIMSVMASLLFLTWVTADEFSFTQTGTQLDQTHTSAQCGISIKYPTNWIKLDKRGVK